MRVIRSNKRKSHPKVGHLRLRVHRGQKGGGQAEHAAAQKHMADPIWRVISVPLEVLPLATREKIKDILYRGAWDWITDH
jgi:hypothetical protein